MGLTAGWKLPRKGLENGGWINRNYLINRAGKDFFFFLMKRASVTSNCSSGGERIPMGI